MRLSEQCPDLGVLREAAGVLLGEDDLAVGDHVELAVAARLDLGHVVGLRIQLGRETRGPIVVAVSGRAVLDQNPGHGEKLPERRPRQIVLNCSNGCRQLAQ
jgi:hypothetical protein